jgi:hypothetical protein
MQQEQLQLHQTILQAARQHCVTPHFNSTTQQTTGATGIELQTGLPAGVTAGHQIHHKSVVPTNRIRTFHYSILLTGGCGTGKCNRNN